MTDPWAVPDLTDAQVRVLVDLDDYAILYGDEAMSRPHGCQARTLERLAQLGLIVTGERPATTVARITPEGRDLLTSMGD